MARPLPGIVKSRRSARSRVLCDVQIDQGGCVCPARSAASTRTQPFQGSRRGVPTVVGTKVRPATPPQIAVPRADDRTNHRGDDHTASRAAASSSSSRLRHRRRTPPRQPVSRGKWGTAPPIRRGYFAVHPPTRAPLLHEVSRHRLGLCLAHPPLNGASSANFPRVVSAAGLRPHGCDRAFGPFGIEDLLPSGTARRSTRTRLSTLAAMWPGVVD